MANSFFGCMIVSNSRHTTTADKLYTKNDPFIKRPQSFDDLTTDEKNNAKTQIQTGNNVDTRI